MIKSFEEVNWNRKQTARFLRSPIHLLRHIIYAYSHINTLHGRCLCMGNIMTVVHEQLLNTALCGDFYSYKTDKTTLWQFNILDITRKCTINRHFTMWYRKIMPMTTLECINLTIWAYLTRNEQEKSIKTHRNKELSMKTRLSPLSAFFHSHTLRELSSHARRITCHKSRIKKSWK